MVTIDEFDQFGQYSNMEFQHKLHQLKFNNIKDFIEASINKTYDLYKKNKKSNISYLDYRNLMLKELERHKTKQNKPAVSRKASNSKIDIITLISDDDSFYI